MPILKNKIKRLKSIFLNRNIEMFIFFVTGRCNLRCAGCFYQDRLSQNKDLSLEEISKIVQTIPKFNTLLISGGEPFLRDDLPQIINLFKHYGQFRILAIPTNGLLAEKILEMMEQILIENRDLERIYLNVSLDGFEPTVRSLRNQEGIFSKITYLLGQAQELRKKYQNFSLQVNTTIYSENLGEILPLAEYLLNNFNLDWHSFELARGKFVRKKIASLPEVTNLYHGIIKVHFQYLRRNKNYPKDFIKRLNFERRAVGPLVYTYQRQILNYFFKKKWHNPCLAGKKIFVLEHDGYLKACELRSPIGRLSELNYDFNNYFSSKELNLERQEIGSGGCHCTHFCFLSTSAMFYWCTIFFEMPYLYIKYKLTKKFL
jgi:MoaA/NifB/PqqE/SkfB family radical SAM enzyme